jgi:hypothetical protein
VRFRASALVIGLSALGVLRTAHAADAPVDDGLLEFLGSVDSEDKDWHDYLAGTDIDQVARRAGHAPPPAPPAAVAPEPDDEPPALSAPPVNHP